MFGFFRKKPKVQRIEASASPGIMTPGFSYILQIPKYIEIRSNHTNVKLHQADYRPIHNHLADFVFHVILEAVISDGHITRLIFSQKHSTNATVVLRKFHYELLHLDYIERRDNISLSPIGSTHTLHIYFDKKKSTIMSEVEFNHEMFDGVWKEFNKSFAKLFGKERNWKGLER